MEKALKDSLKRQKVKKSKNTQSTNSDWQKEQIDLMSREVRKGKDGSKELIRRTLQQTRECRSKDNKNHSAAAMLKKYPALGVSEMVYEVIFVEIINLTQTAYDFFGNFHPT